MVRKDTAITSSAFENIHQMDIYETGEKIVLQGFAQQENKMCDVVKQVCDTITMYTKYVLCIHDNIVSVYFNSSLGNRAP